MLIMETAPSISLNPAARKFLKDLLSGWKQKIFLFGNLPAGWFMGIKIRAMDAEQSLVSLPYSWWSKNPFKSTYFAAQAAAAELSTGALALLHLQGKGKVSMLVKDMEGSFEKKATGMVYFRCVQGPELLEAVTRAIETKEPQTIRVESLGRQLDAQGKEDFVVSRFSFTWTFKVK